MVTFPNFDGSAWDKGKFGMEAKGALPKHCDDPKTKERERWKAEAGLEWKLETTLKVADNLTYTATMETFASLKTLQQSTFRMQNELRVAIWKVVGITIRVELQYDQRQKQGIQYRQNLRAGVNWEV